MILLETITVYNGYFGGAEVNPFLNSLLLLIPTLITILGVVMGVNYWLNYLFWKRIKRKNRTE
ncbi:hypothetical protein DDW13_06400 [Acidianus hospitalis]|uniref:Uncharacterized protein n=1 Tax=Acidianus hospitalis TaxID=563177 RepID=A0A2T9X3P1_9CREN|nr:hypothetical protein DDW13_06400 [Acidianus hospitalis]